MVESNIRYFLKKKNMSQIELAIKIGLTEASVSRYVNGERIPKITVCLKIAEVLGCEVSDLYTITNEDELEEKQ